MRLLVGRHYELLGDTTSILLALLSSRLRSDDLGISPCRFTELRRCFVEWSPEHGGLRFLADFRVRQLCELGARKPTKFNARRTHHQTGSAIPRRRDH